MIASATLFDPDTLDTKDQPESVVVDGHVVRVTEVFRAYWYLAAERQAIFMRRVQGEPGPWTNDEILASHRFTNAYRASDRVSQYLLHRVIYNDSFDERDSVFRILLFKIFNRIDTWEHLLAHVGEPTTENFDPFVYAKALGCRMDAGERLYSAAYIMPSPRLGHTRKHADHLHLLHHLILNGQIETFLNARSLKDLFHLLIAVPSFGPFLAYQYAIDLNYSPHLDFDEMEFVVPGPGALRGIAKCFADTGGLSAMEIIRAMANDAPRFLAESDFEFVDLWGRPLQLIDCQNLFCEVDKYARVAYPELSSGGPTRIKQTYRPDPTPLTLGYPPKWDLPWSADAPFTFATGPTPL